MVTFLKILILLFLFLLLAYPLLPFPVRLRRFSTFRGLRYDAPHNRKNFVFILLHIAIWVVFAILFGLIGKVSDWLLDISFVEKLFSRVSAKTDVVVRIVVSALCVNLLMIYASVFLKGLTKTVLFDPIFGIRREKKDGEEDKAPEEPEESSEDEDGTAISFAHEDGTPEKPPEGKIRRFGRRIIDKVRRKAKPAKEPFGKRHPLLGKIRDRILRVFFKGEEYEHSKNWVLRFTSVLQIFIYITEILYGILFLGMLVILFFPLPDFLYGAVDFVTARIFLYPILPLLVLQEICNFFRTEEVPLPAHKEIEEEEEATAAKEEGSMTELESWLIRNFGTEHHIRAYRIKKRDTGELTVPDGIYHDALTYIRDTMQKYYGYTCKSYLEKLDAAFRGVHLWFTDSFHSQLGEYLLAYTYVRLLSGERQIFITNEPESVEPLKKYIAERLDKLGGTYGSQTWRIQDGLVSSRQDQADVLVLTPKDFESDNLVENNLQFFEEACNAIVIDADRVVNFNTYLCPLIAKRLKYATGGRLRFLFLTREPVTEFADSLKKLFCLGEEPFEECYSTVENATVFCNLWNRESRKVLSRNLQQVYHIEQRLTQKAEEYPFIDGVRILTHVPWKANYSTKAEVNNLFEPVPENSYLIYTDDRCNLPAALYAYTRFRGTKHTVLNIISFPYLLREFFAENPMRYVNNATILKPRATEHVDIFRLRMTELYADGMIRQDGMSAEELLDRIEKACEETGREFVTCPAGMSFQNYLRLHIGKILSVLLNVDEETGRDLVRKYSVITHKKDLTDVYRISFSRAEEIIPALQQINRRVELWYNGNRLGYLDAFVDRIYQHYVPGQSITFASVGKNEEYEIERISDDGCRIYIGRQIDSYTQNLYTFFLRRYTLGDWSPVRQAPGIKTFTNGLLEYVKLEERVYEKIECSTYGFYSLYSDSQTIDFRTDKGAIGKAQLSEADETQCRRTLKNGKALSLVLKSRKSGCTDEMRLLLSAILNEFMRTVFPDAYRCVAVCPVLETTDPVRFAANLCEALNVPEEAPYEELAATFYPYLTMDGDVTDDTMEFLVINDCENDVGVLSKLYNPDVRTFCDLFASVCEYLRWLIRVESTENGKDHFLRFGGAKLPLVFSEDYSAGDAKASEDGAEDPESDDEPEEKITAPEKLLSLLQNCALSFRGTEDEADTATNSGLTEIDPGWSSTGGEDTKCRCAFCHAEVEDGRYSLFDSKRLICFDCMASTISDDGALAKIASAVLAYLKTRDPDEKFPEDCTVGFFPVQDTGEKEAFTEDLVRTDEIARTIRVERDIPLYSMFSAVMHGFIRIWQKDNNLILGDAAGQLYYEELSYLDTKSDTRGAPDWLRENLPQPVRASIEAIIAAIQHEDPPIVSSFAYMRRRAEEARAEDTPDIPDGDLFDAEATPRFWKQFLFTLDDNSTLAIPYPRKNAAFGGKLKNAPPEDEEPGATVTAEVPAGNEPGEEPSGAGAIPEDTSAGETTGSSAGTGNTDAGKTPTDPTGNEPGITMPRRFRKDIPEGKDLFSDELDKKAGNTPNKYSKLYNEIGRHIADLDGSPFAVPAGISDEDVERCYYFVLYDYPQFFWTAGRYPGNPMRIAFRCLDKNQKPDKKLIVTYWNQIKKAAHPFIAGITQRNAKSYEALLTIYRRVIGALDYDTVKLESGYDRQDHVNEEDELRSLHSALVHKKVVCAGYAVAMQYLLQSVGIVCAQITSEGHAWNIVRLGNETFCLDATWDDGTKTTADGDQSGQKTFTKYDHCGVQIADLLRMENDENGHHRPEAIFQGSDALNAVIRETSQVYNYFRHEHLYLTSYDEEKVVNAIVYALKNDESAVAMRFTDEKLRDVAFYELQREKRDALMAKAKEIACQGAGLSAHKIKKATLGDPVAYLKSDSLYIEINW